MDTQGDFPIYSRLFVVCNKNNTEDDLRKAFSKFGQIEEITILNHKGVAFVQFSKTSEAAKALEAMHMKSIPGCNRPIKVNVALNVSDIESKDESDEKYKRIFISAPKSMKEEEIEEVFSAFGKIASVVVLRDQNTGDSKGFAYVTYYKFSFAANAYENCDKKYRAVFAKPKYPKNDFFNADVDQSGYGRNRNTSLISMMKTKAQGYTTVCFLASPHFAKFHYERLFDLIPGLVGFNFFLDLYKNIAKGNATYSNSTSAAYAVEKLNNFEYPCPGSFVFVKPVLSSFNPVEKQIINDIPNALNNLKNAVLAKTESGEPDLALLTKAIADAQKLVKAATSSNDGIESNDANCSVPLPPPKPLADIDSPVAKRCFLVCKPTPPPLNALRDVFCRFGDLIDVYTLPNKTVGYARYASESAADEARKTLHGAEICGIRMKVLEAEEEAPPKKRRFDC